MTKTFTQKELLSIGDQVAQVKKAIKIRNNEEAMKTACVTNSIVLKQELKRLEIIHSNLMAASPTWAVAGSLKHMIDTIHDINESFQK